MNGKTYKKTIAINANQAEPKQTFNLYYDEGIPIAYQAIWVGKRYRNTDNKLVNTPVVLKHNVVYLEAPE